MTGLYGLITITCFELPSQNPLLRHGAASKRRLTSVSHCCWHPWWFCCQLCGSCLCCSFLVWAQNFSTIQWIVNPGISILFHACRRKERFWLAFSWLISLFSISSKMADGPNLFDMTKSAINALKKPEIVKKIMELKDKVVVGEEIKSLRTHIKELTDTVN